MGVIPFLVKNCWTLSMVWAGALVNHPSWNGQTCWKSLQRKFPEAERRLSLVHCTDGFLEHPPSRVKPVLQGAHPPEDNFGFSWVPPIHNWNWRREATKGWMMPTIHSNYSGHRRIRIRPPQGGSVGRIAFAWIWRKGNTILITDMVALRALWGRHVLYVRNTRFWSQKGLDFNIRWRSCPL